MKRGSWATGTIFGAALAVGCGPAASSTGTLSTDQEVLLCEEFTLLNEDGTSFKEHERYIRSAIDRKLRLYPELAATLGFDHVSSCEEGRAFMQGLADYAAVHPGFDDDEPYEAPEHTDPGPNPGPRGKLELPKLLSATATFNYPVVRIANNRNSTCTGFFIAKNWVVTSAHCLAYQGTNSNVKSQPLRGYYPFRLDRPSDGSGALPPVGKIYEVAKLDGTFLQYPHPNWFGWSPTQAADLAPVNDIGLLYIDGWEWDIKLPPNPANSAMRISATTPNTTTTLTQFGWGPGTWTKSTNAVGPTDTLRRGNFIPTSISIQTLRWTVPSTGMRPCIGDSGGPAARLATINGVSQWIAVGALGGNTTDTSGEKCAETTESIGWPRMDDFRVVDFINDTLQIWNGALFKCGEYSLTGTGPAEYRRCWGTPCSSNSDCQTNQNCRGLIEGNSTIKGQCLPKAGLVLGGTGP
jgi:hypothetical protein